MLADWLVACEAPLPLLLVAVGSVQQSARVDPATFCFRLSIPVIFNNFNDSFEPLSNTVRRSTAEPSGANLAGATSARANNPKKNHNNNPRPNRLREEKKSSRSLCLLLAAIIRRFLVILSSRGSICCCRWPPRRAGPFSSSASLLASLAELAPHHPRTPTVTFHKLTTSSFRPTDPDDDGVLTQDHFSRNTTNKGRAVQSGDTTTGPPLSVGDTRASRPGWEPVPDG